MSKKRRLALSGIFGISFFVISCGGSGNVFEPLADKNSNESCKVEVSQNLDKGNYDAVISSSCASDFDKGAAYLGKAGFDIKNVVDRLIDGNKQGGDAIDLYVKALVPQVKPETLDYLDMAEFYYSKIQNSDGKFYTSITQSLKSLTLIKSVITSSGTGQDGDLNKECDLNNNGTPDDVDATACALELAGNGSISGTCSVSGITVSDKGDINIGGQNYRGVHFEFNVSVPSCPSTYKKVYYKADDGNYYLATTSGECKDDNGETWPCPVKSENNKDFVDVLDKNVESMVSNIQSAITNQKSDIKESIEKIRDEIKSSCYDSLNYKQCISQQIANYIKKIKK